MTNNEYIDSLIIENQKLIKFTIKKMNLSWKTEDEFQEYYDNGLIGLINGAKTYSIDKGKPSTYLYTCIKNEISKGITSKLHFKRVINYKYKLSLDEPLLLSNNGNDKMLSDVIPDPNINIEEDFEKKLEKEKLMYAIDKLENKQDKLFLCDYYGLNGHKQLMAKEIEKKYKVSYTTVSNRLKRARESLEKYLKGNDKEVFMLEEKKVLEPSKQKVKAITFKKLNDYLFDQIEKLNNKDADLEKEIPKAKVIAQLSQQIINNANTCLKAVRTVKEFEIDDTETLNLLGFENVKK